MGIKVVIFGVTDMLGRCVLILYLEHSSIQSVLVIERRSCEVFHETLTEVIHTHFLDYTAIADKVDGINACFFCIGVKSKGIKEEIYTNVKNRKKCSNFN